MDPLGSHDSSSSMLIYVAVIVLGIALFVALPFYLVSRPMVVSNAGAQNYAAGFDRTLARKSEPATFPVAHLDDKAIVGPATLAKLNAKVPAQNTASVVHASPRAPEVHAAAPHLARTSPWRRASYPNFTPL